MNISLPSSRLLFVAALFTINGCSLIFNGDKYRVGKGPSQPIVTISPTQPRTDDDVSVVFGQMSTDPKNQAVHYVYAWSLDGEERSSEEILTSELTAKGQRWTLKITPVAEDGRRGKPATLSFDIFNSAPTIRTVGLSTYHPWADERIRAFPHTVRDVDGPGDIITITYRWRRNGTVVPGVSSDTIDLASLGFEAGDQLAVDVIATDAELESPPFSVGPVTVRALITSWRPVLPPRDVDNEDPVHIVYDEPHNRLIYQTLGDVWEYCLDSGNRRWVRLPTNIDDAPILTFSSSVYDRPRSRMLVIGGRGKGGNNTDVFALDLKQRGQEKWTKITPSGESPGARLFSSLLVDEKNDRLLMYGSVPIDSSSNSNTDLWSLNLKPGQEAWTKLSPRGGTPGLVAGSTWVPDPKRNRAYLVGGVFFQPGSTTPTNEIGNRIWRLTLTPNDEEFAMLSETAPSQIILAGSTYDPVRDRGVIIHGGSDFELSQFQPGVWLMNLETGRISVASQDSAPIHTSFLPAVGYDTASDRVVVASGLSSGGRRLDVGSYDPVADTWEGLDVVGLDVPFGTSRAGVVPAQNRTDGILIFGGQQTQERLDVGSNGIWSLSFASGRLTKLTAQPDSTGTIPFPPEGWGFGQWGTSPRSTFFFSGATRLASLANDTWHLDQSTTRWKRITPATSLKPVGREGATFIDPSCGNEDLALFGGWSEPTRTPFRDHWTLQGCTGSGTCQWITIASPTPPARPTHSVYGAAVTINGQALYFGGGNNSTVSNEVWSVNACSSHTQAWTKPSVTPAISIPGLPNVPDERLGHTFTYAEATGATILDRVIVFGGTASPSVSGAPDGMNDTWVLEELGAGWRWLRVLLPAGTPVPRARTFHAAGWDRDRRKLFVFGGSVDGTNTNDLWELRFIQ